MKSLYLGSQEFPGQAWFPESRADGTNNWTGVCVTLSLGRGPCAERGGLALNEKEEEPKDNDRDESQEDIEENLSYPRCAPLLPIVHLGALGDPDPFRVLEIEGHFVSVGVAVLGITLDGPVDDLLQFGRD